MPVVDTDYRPTISSLLSDGFNSIKYETARNYEHGETTDIAHLLWTLQLRIKEQLGYDYPLHSLMDVYYLWLEANR